MAVAAGLAVLGGLTTGMNARQQYKLNKYKKKEKKRNDIASMTSYANAVQRAAMAKAGYKGEVRYAEEAIEIEAQQAQGAAMANAAVSGVTEATVDNVLTDIRRSKGRELSSVDNEYDVALDKIDMQMQDSFEALQNALRTGQVIDMSSDFASILNVGTAALTGYIQGGGFQAKAPSMNRSGTNVRADTFNPYTMDTYV